MWQIIFSMTIKRQAHKRSINSIRIIYPYPENRFARFTRCPYPTYDITSTATEIDYVEHEEDDDGR